MFGTYLGLNDERTNKQSYKQTKICAYINPYSICEFSSVYNVFVVKRTSRVVFFFQQV
jgi:hypothetical protein